jgi:hypothetical protein
LGEYSVTAQNSQGIQTSSCILSAGDPFSRNASETPDIFGHQNLEDDEDDLMDFEEEERQHKRPHIHRKGMAPAFVIGLSDMELKAGDVAVGFLLIEFLIKQLKYKNGRHMRKSLFKN